VHTQLNTRNCMIQNRIQRIMCGENVRQYFVFFKHLPIFATTPPLKD